MYFLGCEFPQKRAMWSFLRMNHRMMSAENNEQLTVSETKRIRLLWCHTVACNYNERFQSAGCFLHSSKFKKFSQNSSEICEMENNICQMVFLSFPCKGVPHVLCKQRDVEHIVMMQWIMSVNALTCIILSVHSLYLWVAIQTVSINSF